MIVSGGFFPPCADTSPVTLDVLANSATQNMKAAKIVRTFMVISFGKFGCRATELWFAQYFRNLFGGGAIQSGVAAAALQNRSKVPRGSRVASFTNSEIIVAKSALAVMTSHATLSATRRMVI